MAAEINDLPVLLSPARKHQDPPPTMDRRDALVRAGYTMLAAAGAVGLAGTARLLFPRVHHTPPSTVVLGSPEQLAVGQVSERWKASHKLVLVRDAGGLYALRAVCTHLGCIPNWHPEQRKFRCPCHGSGFHHTGVNFEGPAPRALERLKIWLDEDGRVVVDTAVRFLAERDQWTRRGAYLPYPASGGDAS